MDILVTRASGVLGKCSRSSNMPQFLLSWALAGTKGEGRSERRREDCREKRARPRGRGTGSRGAQSPQAAHGWVSATARERQRQGWGDRLLRAA